MSAAPARDFDTVVMKFGGSSVADAEKAPRGAPARGGEGAGLRVVGTVSAMGKTTDGLIALANDVRPPPTRARWTCCSPSRARVPVRTWPSTTSDTRPSRSRARRPASRPTSHTKAKITQIRPFRVEAALDEGKIALVAGFQGVSATTKDVTTLGRGGTDATAVALAALGAACEIYSDVPGVFTADPRPCRRPAAAAHLVRRDAGDVGLGRQGADAALGGARPQPRRARARPLDLLGRGGTWIERTAWRTRSSRRDPQRAGSGLHADGDPRRAGRGRRCLRCRRRGGRERRHHPAERRARRRRALLLRAPRGRARDARSTPRCRTSSAEWTSPRTRAWARSRWSAPACARTRASRPRCSAPSPTSRSTCG